MRTAYEMSEMSQRGGEGLSVLPLLPCGDTLGKRVQHSVETLMKKGAAEPPIRPQTENRSYKIFQYIPKMEEKKAEISDISVKNSCYVLLACVRRHCWGHCCYRQLHTFSALYSRRKEAVCTAEL